MTKRKKLLFDYGWRFRQGDIQHKPVTNYMATYHGASAESGRGGAASAYDDSTWEIVDLPHDFVIKNEPDASENSDHGYIHRENGWYRNYFKLDSADHDKKLSLIFDGVATECIIWVNGVELMRNFTAGTSFEVDFTDVAVFGEELNTVSVYIDNSNFEGWYYEGGGLYRHVWLQIKEKIAVAQWGVFVHPEKQSEEEWKVPVEIIIENRSGSVKEGSVRNTILTKDGIAIGICEQNFKADAFTSPTVTQNMLVRNPETWSLDTPVRYRLLTEILENDTVVDEVETEFGFRTLEFHAEKGFLLNGKKVMMKGMCVHQEHGGLGVAIPDDVLEYRVKRLQDMGCNAIRTAHNPPAPELLDICDRLGMLIMEENRWLDSAPEGMLQLQQMICRDRNHPCVIMWSMFNEEAAMEYEFGSRIMNSMREYAHQLDPSRPVTYAQNTGLLIEGVAAAGDVIGVNYNNHWYPILHEMYPDYMLFGSETIGYIIGRLNEPMDTWNTVLKTPYHGGIFAWTGFDYRGEAHWPDVYFRFAAMDPGCFAKDGYYLYQAYWTKEPMAHIVTSWKHSAPIDSEQEVRIYTNGKYAELFADGVSLGKQAVDPAYQTKWDFPYKECVLTARVYDETGNIWAEDIQDWLRKPVKISFQRENDAKLTANCRDTAVYNIYALDAEGKICERNQGEAVIVTLEGSAKILCIGDGDVRDAAPWGSNRFCLRRGHCQVIVRTCDKTGAVHLLAESEHYGNAETVFEIEDCVCQEYVKSEQNYYISAWKRSEVYREIKDPALMLDQSHEDWIDFYTSDCEATHCVLTDGCVGFYAETAVPQLGSAVRSSSKTQIVFESIEVPFIIRITSMEDIDINPYELKIEEPGRQIIDIPTSFTPGSKIQIKIGMKPWNGHDQLTIRRNVFWRMGETEDQKGGR